MPAVTLPLRWRRLLRLSVRSLVVFVLVIGCALGWLIQNARVQRDAVESIERSRGWVEYDHHESVTGEPWPPAWFVDLFGVHLCFPAIYVELPNDAPDGAVAAVSRLRQLRQLELTGTAITDGGMTSLRQLTALKELNLRQTKITDHGLININGLVGLEKLNLDGCNITDAGLAQSQGAHQALSPQRGQHARYRKRRDRASARPAALEDLARMVGHLRRRVAG